ncbi:MAG: phosphotransferase [Pseudomonadota bacterium]
MGAVWGGFADEPELIHQRENIVYRVTLDNGQTAALRLHRDGYHHTDSIHEELQLCETLADTGFACPWPYRTADGDFVYQTDDGKRVTLVQWVPGAPLTMIDVNDLTLTEKFHAVGALLADFHLTADAVALPMPSRNGWSADRLLGQGCPWGDMVSSCDLSDRERTLIRASRVLAKERLADIPAEQQGIIHGDALPDNILRYGETFYLIDYDDCGVGYRAYDLATALVCHALEPDLAAAIQAVQDGYLDAEGPLPKEAFVHIPMFLMLRAQASAAWAATRCQPDDPKCAVYKNRALDLTLKFVSVR